MSSSSSSFEEQKREVLAKIELMIQDTDDKGIQKVLSFLEQRFGANTRKLDHYWKGAVLQLKEVQQKLSRNENVDPNKFSQLNDLLNLVKVENSSYSLPIFESANLAEQYFINLTAALNSCLCEYIPGESIFAVENEMEVKIFYFKIKMKDIDLDCVFYWTKGRCSILNMKGTQKSLISETALIMELFEKKILFTFDFTVVCKNNQFYLSLYDNLISKISPNSEDDPYLIKLSSIDNGNLSIFNK